MILNLLKRITQSLERKHIPYMLSGSIALNSYTVPRMSMGIDIVVELHEENMDDFLSIFGDNFYLNRDTAKQETRRLGMFTMKQGLK